MRVFLVVLLLGSEKTRTNISLLKKDRKIKYQRENKYGKLNLFEEPLCWSWWKHFQIKNRKNWMCKVSCSYIFSFSNVGKMMSLKTASLVYLKWGQLYVGHRLTQLSWWVDWNVIFKILFAVITSYLINLITINWLIFP